MAESPGKKYLDRKMRNTVFVLVAISIIFSACSISHRIGQQAKLYLLKDSITRHAHIGLSVFEPATGKYWYEHDDEKYFVPASNTKLFTLYAGLRLLGDSLPGLKYYYQNGTTYIQPTGDPTFLNPGYRQQKSFDFLKAIGGPISFMTGNWQEQAFGKGWAWDDYTSEDMIERSPFPIYNNVIRWTQVNDKVNNTSKEGKYVFSEPEINWKVNFSGDTSSKEFKVSRELAENTFEITFGIEKKQSVRIPFVTRGLQSALVLLKDTLSKAINISPERMKPNFKVIHSCPVDSLFKPMMQRSDNFYAEQTLLMASNEKFGTMNDNLITNYLLHNDLRDIPQYPSWVDGSGLSRYNLFTPLDFIYILNKMKKDFGFERLKGILPTGGTGTLRTLYKKDSGYIFAKTGTLSNHVALSGFLITKKKKLLIFSILANDFQGGAMPVRKSIEKFISDIRQHY